MEYRNAQYIPLIIHYHILNINQRQEAETSPPEGAVYLWTTGEKSFLFLWGWR